MRHRILSVLLSRLRPGPARNVGSNQRSTTSAGADAYTQARVLSLLHERHLKLVPEVQSANDDDADSDQHRDGSESDRDAGDGRPEGHGGYTPPRAYRGYMIARGMAIVPPLRQSPVTGCVARLLQLPGGGGGQRCTTMFGRCASSGGGRSRKAGRALSIDVPMFRT